MTRGIARDNEAFSFGFPLFYDYIQILPPHLICVLCLLPFLVFSASGCPIASRNKMRVLESGGTVEQHKAAIAAMKYEHQAAACTANGCDMGGGGGGGGASGHLVNGTTFVATHQQQRTLNGGSVNNVGGGTHHVTVAGAASVLSAGAVGGMGKKGATKFDDMSTMGYSKSYGGEFKFNNI